METRVNCNSSDEERKAFEEVSAHISDVMADPDSDFYKEEK